MNGKSIEEIITIIRIETCLVPYIDNQISQACENQISEISKLFMKGSQYVH